MTTTTNPQAPTSLTPEQATGLAHIRAICRDPGVCASHAECVVRLAQRFPGILQLMESIIRRHHNGKPSPGRDHIRIRVQKADQALMAQTGALCDGIYSSIEDRNNYPRMRGWRCEIFFACTEDDRLCGDPVGSEVPTQRHSVRPVASLVAQMGEYMTSIIGLTITGWWDPDLRGSRQNPKVLEFVFTVYKKPVHGFPKLVSSWDDDSFRLQFKARAKDGLQDEVRSGQGTLCPNIRSAVQALMPLVTEFETRMLNGFAEWLELGRSDREPTSSTGFFDDIYYRYSFDPVLPDHSEALDGSHPGAWMSQAMNQPPTHWNVTLEFWRDTLNGKCKVGFFYSFTRRDSHWINQIARELRFDTIDATVNGAENLLRDLTRRWEERRPTPVRAKPATPA